MVSALGISGHAWFLYGHLDMMNTLHVACILMLTNHRFNPEDEAFSVLFNIEVQDPQGKGN